MFLIIITEDLTEQILGVVSNITSFKSYERDPVQNIRRGSEDH